MKSIYDEYTQERLFELKRLLLQKIEGTHDWRMEKADQYPDDAKRNKDAAGALTGLLDYVDSLPDDHELFSLELDIIDFSEGIIYQYCEYVNNEIRMYGFQNQTDPETWVDEVIEKMKALEQDQKTSN